MGRPCVDGHTMRIGAFELPNRLFVAPMAGVTDLAFDLDGAVWV